MSLEPTPEEVSWDRKDRIFVPTNGFFALRTLDWIRIRRDLLLITTPIPWLRIIYPLLIGVGITTGLSLLIIPSTENISPYVIPLYQCVTFFSIVISIVFILLDRQIHKRQQIDVKNIILYMKDIEQTISELKDLPQLIEMNSNDE